VRKIEIYYALQVYYKNSSLQNNSTQLDRGMTEKEKLTKEIA
jgi:hypothetical protein